MLFYINQKSFNDAYFAMQVSYWEKQASRGDVEALFSLAKYYHFARNEAEKDESKAFEYYLRAAEKGHAKAQNNLGVFFKTGSGTEPDLEKAFYWYEQSAINGDFTGMKNLTNLSYQHKRYAEAFKWSKKAAELGDVIAQSKLGTFYNEGIGTDVDYEKGFYWLKESAESGHAIAQINLGNSYFRGRGVEKDLLEAGFWYERAAKRGKEDPKRHIQESRQLCITIKKPNSTEVQNCLIASGAGFSDAQQKLSELYLFGHGVPKNFFETYAWAFTALASERPDATFVDLDAKVSKMLADNDITISNESREKMKAKAKEYAEKYGGWKFND